MKRLSIIIISVLGLFSAASMKADKSSVTIPKWDRFVEVTGSNVNLRMTPGVDGEKLVGQFFAKGEVVPVLDETDQWVKAYYVYSPTQYVWLAKQFTRETLPEPLPAEYRFTSYLTYGDQMLTYCFDGKPTNIVYSADYPFATTKTLADEPNLYSKDDDRYLSASNMDIDWETVMPQIIKTIPDECVYEYFRGVPLFGKSHNFRTDHGTTVFHQNFFDCIYEGDAFYKFSIFALPTHEPDQLFLIALSESGLDGSLVNLLASMRYNISTGEYSDIRFSLPGVVIDKLGLNYDVFADIPECQREARQSSARNITVSLFYGIPMVTVKGPEFALAYPVGPFDTDGYTAKTSVYYLWDGDKFVKMVRSPYIDMLQAELQQLYEVHAESANDDFSEAYPFLMPFFAEACRAADAASAETATLWLCFDPFTFFPKGQKYKMLDIQVVSASPTDENKAIVDVYSMDYDGEFGSKKIIVKAMIDSATGRYLISDFMDENGVSVLKMAQSY